MEDLGNGDYLYTRHPATQIRASCGTCRHRKGTLCTKLKCIAKTACGYHREKRKSK